MCSYFVLLRHVCKYKVCAAAPSENKQVVGYILTKKVLYFVFFIFIISKELSHA